MVDMLVGIDLVRLGLELKISFHSLYEKDIVLHTTAGPLGGWTSPSDMLCKYSDVVDLAGYLFSIYGSRRGQSSWTICKRLTYTRGVSARVYIVYRVTVAEKSARKIK
jgi:hypothetical protein